MKVLFDELIHICNFCPAQATQAASLAGLPFLSGEDGAWVERKRRERIDVLGHALDCLADACLSSDDPSEAAKWADQAIALEPFRESGYRRLMHAHAAAGNGAEALRGQVVDLIQSPYTDTRVEDIPRRLEAYFKAREEPPPAPPPPPAP